MRFTHDWQKLHEKLFTTIRKDGCCYQPGRTYGISTPSVQFRAKVLARQRIHLNEISNELALLDAEMSAQSLRKFLRKFYGKKTEYATLLVLLRVTEVNEREDPHP